jgi:uncharacterized delta-60 repeat protein
MKKIIIPVLFMIFVVTSHAQWISNFGGNNLGDIDLTNAKGNAVTVDNSGFSYVTGFCNDGTAGNDIVTIKYNEYGDTLWVRSYNGTANNDDAGFGICVDASGNVYVVGSTMNTGKYHDLTLLKYNPYGELGWIQTYAGTENYNEDKGLGIAVDGDGNIYVTGYSTDYDLKTDIVTQKYDADGNRLWSVLEDGIDDIDSRGLGIAVDNAGNVCVTGFTSTASHGTDIITVKYNPSGSQLWLMTFNGNGSGEDKAFGIAVDDNDNIYITGYCTNDNADYAILRYSESGSLIWSASYNGTGNNEDKAFGIAVDENGNSYITGYSMTSENDNDYVTLKVNSGGTISWSASYNGTGNGDDKANAIGIIFSGGCATQIAVTGESWGTNDNYDYATVRYNITSGSQTAASRYSMSGTSNDIANDIAVSPDNAFVIITGFSEIIIEGHANSSYISTLSSPIKSELTATTNTPSAFSLHQNYPNPFNPSTNIKFDLQSKGNVKLTVYDMLGKTVDVLVNQYLEAGSYNISYSNNGLSSGIYFYELQAGGLRDIKKMTLVK